MDGDQCSLCILQLGGHFTDCFLSSFLICICFKFFGFCYNCLKCIPGIFCPIFCLQLICRCNCLIKCIPVKFCTCFYQFYVIKITINAIVSPGININC